MEMKICAVLAVITALATPAFAQQRNFNPLPPSKAAEKTPQQRMKELEEKRIEEIQYKKSLSKIPDHEAKPDPWAGVR